MRRKVKKDNGLRTVIIRNVPEMVRQKLKAKAAVNCKSMQGVILELIEEYLEREED